MSIIMVVFKKSVQPNLDTAYWGVPKISHISGDKILTEYGLYEDKKRRIRNIDLQRSAYSAYIYS